MQNVVSTQEECNARDSYLSFSIGEKNYYIALEKIRQIIPEPNVVAVGHTKEWFGGMLKVQGDILSIVDVSKFIDKSSNCKKKMAIALSSDVLKVAFFVDDILGIEKFTLSNILREDGFVDIYKKSEKQELSILSIDRLSLSSDFMGVSVF